MAPRDDTHNASIEAEHPHAVAPSGAAAAATATDAATAPNALGSSDSVASESKVAFTYSELEYAMNSFYAIVQPVLMTMVLSASAVIFISTPESNAATTAAMEDAYNVVHSNDTDSNATQLGNSLINGLVIVSFICAATFAIVLLYKYRCMSCLIGYMIFSSTLLLGFLASMMVEVAIERYKIEVDTLTFYFVMYNFAIVGVVSIFGGPFIVPTYMTQAYLILTSVIVAWQLSHLQPFLAWVLLVLLALYDLFAVLTPCGPLKALVNLMSKEDSPNMPGLLYEASLPSSQRQARRNRPTPRTEPGTERSADDTNYGTIQRQPPDTNGDAPSTVDAECDHVAATNGPSTSSPDLRETAAVESLSTDLETPYASTANQDHGDSGLNEPEEEDIVETVEESPLLVGGAPAEEALIEPSRIARVPLALAKVYKLRFLHDPQPPWMSTDTVHSDDASIPETVYTAEQLCGLVDVVFPRNGGRIAPTLSLDLPNDLYRATAATDETRYTVLSARGEARRVIFVNSDGRIFEDLREANAAQERKERTSIRLGLGDFIFYSILVSKAALFSFTTFAVCTLAILSGLGLTLLLLAVYGAALPALPVSIALGVVFYLFTRFIMEPWVEAVFTEGVYV